MKKLAVYLTGSISRFSTMATVALTFLLAPTFVDHAHAQQPATEQEAQAIGVNAYLYFYSLVTMDITRQQLTNVEPEKDLAGQ